MKKKILTIILAGLTAIAEVYVLNFENMQFQHGLRYFIDLCIIIGLPLLTIVSAIYAFKKEHSEEEQAAAPPPEVSDSEKHTALLKKLVSENQPIAESILMACEQIERFEKKSKLALKLSDGSTRSRECKSVLTAASKVFYSRLEELERLCDVFDAQEYRKFLSGSIKLADNSKMKQKSDIFASLHASAKNIVQKNEELILRIDEVIKTLSETINDTDWDASSILAMGELEAFVKNNEKEIESVKDVNKLVADQLKEGLSML